MSDTEPDTESDQDPANAATGDTPGPDQKSVAIARAFIEALPHSKALGMRMITVGDGHAVIDMPYNPQFVGDPDTGVIHGGAVSALMDTCGGAAVMAHPVAPKSAATLDLRIDYMRPATPGQTISARAECYHMTRTVAFVRATAFDDDSDRPVATATGAFAVEPSS